MINDPHRSIPSSARFPALRVWLFSPFQMAWVDEMGQDHPLTEEQFEGKDVPQALTLLQLLLCQPGRQAHRDWILEQFWPDHGHRTAVHRFHNIATALRKLVSPPDGEPLLPPVTGRNDSGSLYVVSGYPRLWVDLDAIAWNVEQAARLERFGDDALAYWQRAWDLLKRGPFLMEEPYASWTQVRQSEIAVYARQCVHSLSRLYQADGKHGQIEALLLLQTYWQQHPTDEDVLCPLLTLLGEQERYQEVEEYYQQYIAELVELGPDEQGNPRTELCHSWLNLDRRNCQAAFLS